MERCADCHYFRDGECRRKAPENFGTTGLYKVPSPTVPPDFWCGEFKPKAGDGEGVTMYRVEREDGIDTFVHTREFAEGLIGHCNGAITKGTWTKDNT